MDDDVLVGVVSKTKQSDGLYLDYTSMILSSVLWQMQLHKTSDTTPFECTVALECLVKKIDPVNNCILELSALHCAAGIEWCY